MLLTEIMSPDPLLEIDALLEGVTDLPADADLNTQLEILMQRLETIKKALGLTNKLPAGESRKYHRSRIMGFMNKVRALFNRVAAKLEAEMQADEVPTTNNVATLPVNNNQQTPPTGQFQQAA